MSAWSRVSSSFRDEVTKLPCTVGKCTRAYEAEGLVARHQAVCVQGGQVDPVHALAKVFDPIGEGADARAVG